MGNASSKAPHNRHRQTHKHRDTHKHQRSHKHRRSYHRGGTTPLSKLNPAYHLNPPPAPKAKYRNTSREESLRLEVLDESVPPMFRHLKNKKKAIAEKKAQKSKSTHSKK